MNMPAENLSAQSEFVRPFWTSLFGPPWLLSLLCVLLVAAVRFFITFSPWPLQELYFLQTVALWALPFLLLTHSGRLQIGLTTHGVSPSSILTCVAAGTLSAAVFFALGILIYGNSPDNWCISIRNYLHFEEMRGIFSPLGLFALYALPAITLNPIAEEILFRGFLQESFARKVGPAAATLINSVIFGLLYLYLHGLRFDSTGFHIRLVSSFLAVSLMAGIGAVFTLCRTRTGSLWPAVAAHSAFSLTILALAIYTYDR